MSKVPAIPAVDPETELAIKRVLTPMKTMLEIREGQNPNSNPRDKNVTYQDLIDLGLITKDDLPT